MSPVSRGRKPKKKSGKAKSKARKSSGRAPLFPAQADSPVRSDLAFAESAFGELAPGEFGESELAEFDDFDDLTSPLGSREEPEWFDAAIGRILDQAETTMVAEGPRQLEQMVAELVGAELHLALTEERSGMWFEWLVQELIDSAAFRIVDDPGPSDPAWAAFWRLLYGLSSILPPGSLSVVMETLARVRKALPTGAIAGQPQWLTALPKINATGEVWEMHDAYGTRFGVIAGFRYPGAGDEHMFLFDVDACGPIVLAGAGDFDDLEAAAAAWRAPLGDAAAGSTPSPVDRAGRLLCLAYLDPGDEDLLIGSEPRIVLDNFFRAGRRLDDLAKVLRKKRMRLPATRSLFHDIDIEPGAEEFTAWYEQRHGLAPDAEAVEAIA
ncbi:MAG: hypothetical protein ACRDPO_00375, partial [Streptosporangiaceae bacterium]